LPVTRSQSMLGSPALEVACRRIVLSPAPKAMFAAPITVQFVQLPVGGKFTAETLEPLISTLAGRLTVEPFVTRHSSR
jgi:hypothetical protein